MIMSKKPYPPYWRRRGGPLGPHGGTAERLAELYAGTETKPLPSDMEALLDRLDMAEARRTTETDTEQLLSQVC